MLLSELAGADIGILGTGREGQAAWRWLRARLPGQALTLYTEGQPPAGFSEELEPGLDRLHQGPLAGFDLARHQVLVRSPGISPLRRELQDAVRAGARITTASNLWFAAHPAARTLCITGTKGKSTTTALTAHLLSAAGREVITAGNFGRPMLEFEDADPDWWVIELSSYQLHDLEGRPGIGALLNLSDEHLDWHGDARRYRAAKLRLAGLLAGRPLVANHADPGLRAALADYAGITWFNHPGEGFRVEGEGVAGPGLGPDGLRLPGLPGRHNLANLAAALTLVAKAGVPVVEARRALADFRGLPHRLHVLGERDGLRWVDDSLATTPVATLAALDALGGAVVTLLVGGFERGVDWSGLAGGFRAAAPHAVIGLPDNGPRVLSELAAGGLSPEGGMHQAGDLAAAVSQARELTPAGGTVLLSPGAPSFPRFRDYQERGLAFARLAGFPGNGT